jgi:SAM-dependent methyltransferase
MSAPPPRAKGDHFSGISAGYAAFRPRYPRALFEFLATVPERRRRAWDCGAGTGQATSDLAEWFDEVIATDVSAEQIAQAPAHPGISWRAEAAESTSIESGTIDLVTVAQALHWFDHERFYAEVRRVSAPGGAIAAWMYGGARMDGEAGSLLRQFATGTVGGYWPPERRFVDDAYASIPFPFHRIQVPGLCLEETWTREQLVGYARTWSSTTRYAAANGVDPVIELDRELARVWRDGEARRVEWPLTVLAGAVSA